MDENRKEELKGVLQEFAGVFDAQADEYEQRIAEYEEALNEVTETLNGLNSSYENTGIERAEDNPDALMSSFLLEEEELTGLVEEGRLKESGEDREKVKRAVEALQRIQNMGSLLEDSMGDAEYSGLKDALTMLKDMLETAITEAKADYATALDNIERLSRMWNMFF